jgi:hypothetical protein
MFPQGRAPDYRPAPTPFQATCAAAFKTFEPCVAPRASLTPRVLSRSFRYCRIGSRPALPNHAVAVYSEMEASHPLRPIMIQTTEVNIPILTWHAINIGGNDYGSNQHIAFREDLEVLHQQGFRIVPLIDIARALVQGRLQELKGTVGLSMDDGSDFDFYDVPHPTWGPQRGMARILGDFRARHGAGAQPHLHATSFVIVSPDARKELDRTCMIGCRWWNDQWWSQAESGGLMAIENHSWDHNHQSLARTVAASPAGGFDLRTHEAAKAEVAQASQTLTRLRGRSGEVLFAYPYGIPHAFLAGVYLPSATEEHGVFAAFSTDPMPVTPEVSRWAIPRFVSGSHWKSPDELVKLLKAHRCLPAEPHASPVTSPVAARQDWRDHLKTWEVNDASKLAGDLFKRCFHHEIPNYARHFVLVYSPPPGTETVPQLVAYVHQSPFGEVHLCGGLCVNERAYRKIPKWLFEAVRNEGGFSTIIMQDSMKMLGDSPASFAHVGEPRSRASCVRVGFLDTGRPHLMALWLDNSLPESVKAKLVDQVEAYGPF